MLNGGGWSRRELLAGSAATALGVFGTPQLDTSLTPLYSCTESGATVFEQFPAVPSSCQATKFTRKVYFAPVQSISGLSSDENAYSEMVVTVKVSWNTSNFSTQSYTLSEDLYNWQSTQ